mgnify:CR=1 FL=1
MIHIDPVALSERFARSCFLDPQDKESAARLALAGALGFGPKVTSGPLTVAELVEMRLAPILADLAEAAALEVKRAYEAGLQAGQELIAPAKPGDLA